MQRHLLAVHPNGHLGKNTAILLGLQLDIRSDRHVGIPEERHRVFCQAKVHRIPLWIHLMDKRGTHQLLVQLLLKRRYLREDVRYRMVILFLRRLIRTILGKTDVIPRECLTDKGI